MKQNSLKVFFVSLVSGGVAGLLATLLVINSMMPDYTSIPPETTSDVSKQNNSIDYQELLKDKTYVSQEDLVVEVVEKVSPSVVSIIITKDVPVLEEYYEEIQNPFGDLYFPGPAFDFRVPQYRDSGETEEKEIGGGSGFIVNPDGYIVTNRHVVDEEDANYTVFTNDGDEYDAKIIDKDTLNDLAILKIEGENFPYIEFGDSDSLKPGKTVIAIGNPLLEFNNSVSLGIVSGLSRNITASTRFIGKPEFIENVIQTDAAINPGNSGGPLLTLDGKVIGVNVAIANGENIGFSIPSNSIKPAIDSVIENGRIIRPYLGVRYIRVNEALKEKNNLSSDYGVLVTRGETIEDLAVIPGSPADKAGIQENDIILEIDGEVLDKDKSLYRIIASKKAGDEIELKLLHKGEERTVKVVLEEPDEEITN